jgi:hypothetical protein
MEVVSSILGGFAVINPLDITEFDIQTQNYTMSADHSEGAQQEMMP